MVNYFKRTNDVKLTYAGHSNTFASYGGRGSKEWLFKDMRQGGTEIKVVYTSILHYRGDKHWDVYEWNVNKWRGNKKDMLIAYPNLREFKNKFKVR